MKKFIFSFFALTLMTMFVACDGKSTTEKVENDSTAVDSIEVVDSTVVDSVVVDSVVVDSVNCDTTTVLD